MEFENDNIQSENPFVDKLFKNLKILAYNCIIKDEYTANRLETEESLRNADIYMACMENRVSLAMFENIPEQFLRAVGLPDYIIRSYYNTGCTVDFIPKDNPAEGITYRSQLVSILRPWFLLNYTELNDYYRKITGQPPLNDWGIPVRDYESYIPDGFVYQGDFFHEIGLDACRDLEAAGVLDIVRQDYPNAKYLDYLTSGLSVYDVRKSLDFMILWMPDTCDYYITEEFRQRYQERRDFLLRTVYNSAMEIESEHYHSVMQIYLLVMTMVDMLADVQTHIAKKDFLDRRCIQYFFDMYGVPYFKDIPYKYQERICHNLHNLIKYKACSHNFEIIKKIFDMPDLEFFRYYLVKVRKRDENGDPIWEGEEVKKSIYNDEYTKTTTETIDIVSDDIKIPFPIEDYLQKNYKIIVIADGNIITDYTIQDNYILFLYEDVKDYISITVYFLYTEDEFTEPIQEELQSINVQDHYSDIPHDINIKIDFPIENYLENGNQIIVLVDGRIFTNYTINDNYIYIIYDDIKDYSTIEVRFIYSISDTKIENTTIDVEEYYLDKETTEDIKVLFPIENYIATGNQIVVLVDGVIFTNYTTDNYYLYIKYEDIKDYSTIEIRFTYSTSITVNDTKTVDVEEHYKDIVEKLDDIKVDFPIENFLENSNKIIVIADGNVITTYYTTDTYLYFLYEEIQNYTTINVFFIYSSSILNGTDSTIYPQDYYIELPQSYTVDFPIENFLENDNYLLVFLDKQEFKNYTTNSTGITINYDDVRNHSTIDIYFIYSTISNAKIVKEEAVVSVRKATYIDIPEPFEGFIQNGWPLLALVEADNSLIDESHYDIIDSTFSTYPVSILPQYLAIKFLFFYLDTEPYTYKEFQEDYDKTTELVFSKVSDSELYSVKHILDETTWKYYDIMVSKDSWWLGKNYKDNYYNSVKDTIFDAIPNFIRCKYYSIARAVELTSNASKLSFFYSALFDDVLKEENLTLKISSLSNIHSFNMGHVFLYLTVLTSIYYGKDDIFLYDLTTHNLAAGFNFKASLSELRDYIISQHFEPDMFKVWDMIIPSGQVEDIKEFMNIQENNDEIYHYIQHEMVDADDYREYLVWQYIYNYLMTWEFNQDYFKLNSGELASSYTDYLKEKDIILYNSIMTIKAIDDEELRVDTISSIIDDACYILEEYINNELSNYLFSEFVGHSTVDILNYVIKLIEFFKSIKIVFRDRGEQASMGTGGIKTVNEDTVFIYYDSFDCKCIRREIEYLHIDEDLHSKNIIKNIDQFDDIREDCVITHKINGIKEAVYNVS